MMSMPTNKEHDAEYWRKKYEKMREGLEDVLSLTQDTLVDDETQPPLDDIVHDTQVTAYRYLYEQDS